MSGAVANTAIIRVGPLYFVMSELPARLSRVMMLILPEARHRPGDALWGSGRGSADILQFDDRGYFAFLIEPQFEVTGAARDKFIEDVLRHAWVGLVDLGFVSGDMPEPVEGDPRKML